MDCVMSNDLSTDIKVSNNTQAEKLADWYSDFKAAKDLFENEAKKAATKDIGSSQLVHDICTKDVRDFSMKNRTISQTVPCNPDGSAGCRGGALPNGVPSIYSIRVLCADERLSPATGCDRIINDIEFEVVLLYGANTFVVITPKETFPIYFYDFYKFPSFVRYPNNAEGLVQFKEELKVIDGSCKAIEIVSAEVVPDGNNCVLNIVYNVYDKLWKYENLIVLAYKFIPDSTVVCEKFDQGHKIESCVNGAGSSCCG